MVISKAVIIYPVTFVTLLLQHGSVSEPPILINSIMSPEPQLTGLAKTFNSVTFTGRANVAKVCPTLFAFWNKTEPLSFSPGYLCFHHPDCGGGEGEELSES